MFVLDDGEGTEGSTMLAALDAARIFRVTPNEAGSVSIKERCDEFYSANLTREQLIHLADELRAVADAL